MSHTVRPPRGRGRFRWAPLAVIATLSAAMARAPAGHIAGIVRDSSGAGIAHAQVMVVGTVFNTLTDSSGRYRIAGVPVGRYTVRAAFIGYKSAEVEQVPVRENQTTPLDLLLLPTAVELQEITVVTYGQPLEPRDETARVPTGANSTELAGRAPGTTPMQPAQAPTPAPAPVAQMPSAMPVAPAQPDWNTENYAPIAETRFLPAAANPRSTFSIDVDQASYTNVRRYITGGVRPPAGAVRIEELLNYFRYDYPEPRGKAPFSVTTDVAVAPWAPEHRLVRIGIRGRSLETRKVPPSNLVFLLDVSGSMMPPDKLPLVKQGFRLLVDQLRPEDQVAIVVYAGAAGLVLPPTPGSDKATILAALDRLEAGGSTAGGAGLRLAYDVARQGYRPDRNNRVILATDGDFNIGESSDDAMVRLIEERRDQGIFLTVLGFGTGNLKDSRMEQIADKGNGHYGYVDNLNEARRMFVREFAGTLVTIAKDVKIQVEFNPAKVAEYRLIGYENRALRNEDFADDRKDAGELGAGHTVTALYEVIPTGPSAVAAGEGIDSLRYQTVSLRSSASGSDEWLTVQLRYKEPMGTSSRLLTQPLRVRGAVGEPTGDFRFAAAVAGFGLVLRGSEYKGSATLDQVLALARGAEGADPQGERAEFVRLVESARMLELAAAGTGVEEE